MRHIGQEKKLVPFFAPPISYRTEQVGDKMKPFKAICAASVLALSLSIPAYADDPNPGDVHDGLVNPIGGIVTPPKPGSPIGSGSANDNDSIFTVLDIMMALASIF